MIEVRIPLRTVSQAHGARCHWAVTSRKRAMERMTIAMFLNRHRPPELPCVVTLVRVSPGTVDDDNLRTCLKSIRDQTAIWLGLPRNKRGHAEDRDPRVHWVYRQGRGWPREYGVIIQAATVTQAEVDAARAAEEWRPQEQSHG